MDITDKQVASIFSSLGIKPEKLSLLYPRIVEPLAKPSDLELTPREFFYWTDKGIIDIPKSEEGQSPWSRLNLLEVIWIKIVKELRQFNFPFASIVKIKEDLFQNILLKLLEIEESDLNEICKSFKGEDFKTVIKSVVSEAKKNPDSLKQYSGPLSTPIGSLLSDILILNRQIYIHICKVGDNFPIVFEGYSMQNSTQETLDLAKNRTHLTLYLNDLIAEYLLDVKYEKINIEFGLISEQEIKILTALKKKEVREINIKKDHNETLTYTITSRAELKDDQAIMIKRLLRMNEFDDVRVVLRNDKHIYIENKARKKL